MRLRERSRCPSLIQRERCQAHRPNFEPNGEISPRLVKNPFYSGAKGSILDGGVVVEACARDFVTIRDADRVKSLVEEPVQQKSTYGPQDGPFWEIHRGRRASTVDFGGAGSDDVRAVRTMIGMDRGQLSSIPNSERITLISITLESHNSFKPDYVK